MQKNKWKPSERHLRIHLCRQHISHVAMRQSGTSAPANSRIWWVMSSVSSNKERKHMRDTSTLARPGQYPSAFQRGHFDWELSWAVKYYTSYASNSQEPLHLPHLVTCLHAYLATCVNQHCLVSRSALACQASADFRTSFSGSRAWVLWIWHGCLSIPC
jgi:hypothetical protein